MRKIICRLLLPPALGVCVSLATIAHAQNHHRDLASIEQYTLTMPGVTNYWETIGSLMKVAKDHPELKDAIEIDSDKHEDLAAIEKRMGSAPVLKTAITDHGLTVRDFVLIQITLFQSALAAAMAPAGPERVKKAHEAHVNPANIDFVEKHKDELEALQAKNLPKEGGGA